MWGLVGSLTLGGSVGSQRRTDGAASDLGLFMGTCAGAGGSQARRPHLGLPGSRVSSPRVVPDEGTGRTGHGRLVASAGWGVRPVRSPARPAAGRTARGGAGALVAAGMVLGFWLLTPASSAHTSGSGHPQGSGPRTAVEWAGFAGNAQHTAAARARAQPFRRIRWRAKVDLAPVLSFGELLIHYGSPMITAANTVLVPTRVSKKAGFRVVAYSGTSGAPRWSLNTDWRPPAFTGGFGAWTPPLPAVLTPRAALAVAGGGGTILVRRHANKTAGAVRRVVFYGAAQWRAHRSVYDRAVQITTPLTAAADGSVYFGFTVTGSTPAHLSSGIARIDAHGHATWITAAAAAGNPAMNGVALNCAPALSPSGTTVYITVTSPTRGILVGLNATTLKPRFHALLNDPVSGRPESRPVRPPQRRSDRTGTCTTASSRIRSRATTTAAGCCTSTPT
jgi:hypothetical protein